MSQTKTVSRKVAAALAALCIIALIALNISIFTYWQEINAKNATLTTRDNEITDLQNQTANLQNALTSAQQQLAELNTTKVIAIGLQYTDNRTTPEQPFLTVKGYIVNTGTANASNCTIHITATRGNTTAIDATTDLGALDAGAWKPVNAQFAYEGEPLQAVNALVEWTP